MPEPCEDCDKLMSASAAVCPHCGHRQSGRDMVDPELVGPKQKPKNLSISGEEAAALFAVKGLTRGGAGYERPRGPMALIVPRDEANGWVRGLEWLLTLLALPLLFGLFSLVIFSPRRMRSIRQSGEVALSLAAGALGAVGIWLLALGTGLSGALLWTVVGVSGVALLARLVVRSIRPG